MYNDIIFLNIGGTTFPMLILYILLMFFMNILDIFQPLDEPRGKLPLIAEHFILDEQKYYFPILIYQLSVILYGITIVLSTETINMAYAHHACGLFAVTG